MACQMHKEKGRRHSPEGPVRQDFPGPYPQLADLLEDQGHKAPDAVTEGSGRQRQAAFAAGRGRRGTHVRAAVLIRPRSCRSSAICTALRAAPLRRLSATTQRFRPFSTVESLRMRLTKTGNSP